MKKKLCDNCIHCQIKKSLEQLPTGEKRVYEILFCTKFQEELSNNNPCKEFSLGK